MLFISFTVLDMHLSLIFCAAFFLYQRRNTEYFYMLMIVIFNIEFESK